MRRYRERPRLWWEKRENNQWLMVYDDCAFAAIRRRKTQFSNFEYSDVYHNFENWDGLFGNTLDDAMGEAEEAIKFLLTEEVESLNEFLKAFEVAKEQKEKAEEK